MFMDRWVDGQIPVSALSLLNAPLPSAASWLEFGSRIYHQLPALAVNSAVECSLDAGSASEMEFLLNKQKNKEALLLLNFFGA